MAKTFSPPVIIPTLLTKSRAEFVRKLKLIEGRVEFAQVDVMDNKFVPNKTWFDAKSVSKMKTKVLFELDLMVKDPIAVMTDWMKVPGLRRVYFHVESPVRIPDAIREAREHGLEVGLGISPGTPLNKVTAHLKKIDAVLVMGNKPGFGGEPLDSNTIDTVRAIRKLSKTIPIGFDIHVTRETIPTLVIAGVTRLCAGGSVFKAKNPRKEIGVLEKIAVQAAKTV
jgi:ribulose-phosphate 3-epimerase